MSNSVNYLKCLNNIWWKEKTLCKEVPKINCCIFCFICLYTQWWPKRQMLAGCQKMIIIYFCQFFRKRLFIFGNIALNRNSYVFLLIWKIYIYSIKDKKLLINKTSRFQMKWKFFGFKILVYKRFYPLKSR